MTLPMLTVIPAGAGSGKTYTIQKQLSGWLRERTIAPERIVAVTFTEAAASELRDRIRAELVREGLHEEALRLDQAYISTIHAFGLRLLQEFPFEAGLSPTSRLLSEDEERVLVANALPFTEKADKVMARLDHYGYTYEWGSGKSGEDVFRDRLLAMIGRLRSIGCDGPDEALLAPLRAAIDGTYGPTGDQAAFDIELHRACEALLEEFPDDLSANYPDNNAASSALRKDHRNLLRVARGEGLGSDWRLWQALREPRTSKRGSPLPEPYDDLAADVQSAANALLEHPGPRDEAVAHGEALLGSAQDCLARYAEQKRQRGLVDYTDMVTLAYRLLSESPEACAALHDRVDCLVIDEFQDTNPIQFSLLWALHRAGVPALVVGDVKQSIMSFQGADPRLFQRLEKTHADAVAPLDCNWRTQSALMGFLNSVGGRLFQGEYTELAPKANIESALEPLEVIVSQSCKVGESKDSLRWTVATRIRDLLSDPSVRVWDKDRRESRPVRGEDIAVLCRSHSEIEKYAAALREVGIRPRVDLGGWYATRIVQLACHALAYVADPADRHAALYLAVTELGGHDLESALATSLDGDDLDEPVLRALDGVASGPPDRPVDTLVDEAIDALGLWDRFAEWPDAPRARANLLRLCAEAGAFVGSNREALAASGFYGSGLKTFLAWLPTRTEREDPQPEPRVRDEQAVEVRTWHSAKGREWPIVVVATMCTKIEPRLPSLTVQYDGFGDLGRILDAAHIEFAPSFAAPETRDKFKDELMDDARADARRLLYVAFTRAREKLIIEWPTYLEDKEYETCWALLRDEAGLALGDDVLSVDGQAFGCHKVVAECPPDAGGQVAAVEEALPVIGRRALQHRPVPERLTPESVRPSMLEGTVEVTGTLRHIDYGPPLDDDLTLTGAARGDLLHQCFEILSGHPERRAVLNEALAYEFTDQQVQVVAEAVERFDGLLDEEFGAKRVGREVPVLALDDRGSVVSGLVDVLVETDAGLWIVDHKSDRVDDREARFREYLPQLMAYVDAVGAARPDRRVLGVAINWISYGEATVLASGVG